MIGAIGANVVDAALYYEEPGNLISSTHVSPDESKRSLILALAIRDSLLAMTASLPGSGIITVPFGAFGGSCA